MKLQLWALALSLAGSLSLNASPSLIGSSATVNFLYPNSSNAIYSSAVTVSSGVEITCTANYGGGVCAGFGVPGTIDIGASSILIHQSPGSLYTASALTAFNSPAWISGRVIPLPALLS